MSDQAKREYNIWYCVNCGMTYRRYRKDPDNLACGNCKNGRMELALVLWYDEIPDPDPLESLLIGVTTKDDDG